MSQPTQEIILSSSFQDFASPKDLRDAFAEYRKQCEAIGQVRTLPGLCRALNISKSEYFELKKGEYKKEFEQVELSIKHELINQGIRLAGAWRYLESEWPDEYRKEVEPAKALNMIFNVEQLNLIARRIVADSKPSQEEPHRLSDSKQS